MVTNELYYASNKLVYYASNKLVYYEVAKKGSLNKNHPSFAQIHKYGKKAKRILDLGCGEGTRLSLIKNKRAEKVGVDISAEAIKLAKKRYGGINFIKINNKIPFQDGYFDFVYSAFVLEHTEEPEAFLSEAIRVTSSGGTMLLVAPNFGAPNRASPNYKKNRLLKLLGGLRKDFNFLFGRDVKRLGWQKVNPQKDYQIIDADTLVEPYVLSLEKFLRGKGLRIVKASSLWGQENKFSLFQLPFRILGTIGIIPFKFWGPHLLVVGIKYA